jgi:PAS domain S-box-containing protein
VLGSPSRPDIAGPSRRLVTARSALWFGAILGCGVVAIGAFTIWYLRHEALAEAAERAEYGLGVIRDQAGQAFRMVDAALEAALPDALAVIADPSPAGLARRHERLKDFAALLPHVRGIGIFDARGDLVVDSRQFPPRTPRSVADREHFRAQRDDAKLGFYIGPPVLNRADGLVSITVSRGVRARDGAFLGVVAAAVEPRHFAEAFRSAVRHPEDMVTIQLSDGRALARYPHSDDLAGFTFAGGKLAQALSRGATKGTHEAVSRFDGIDRIIAFQLLDRYPVAAVVGLSKRGTLAYWHRTAPIIAATTAAIAGVIALFTWFIFREAKAHEATLARMRVWVRGLEGSPMAMVLVDAVGPGQPIIYANAAMGSLTGYSPQELIGKNCRILQGPASDPEARAALRAAIADGRPAAVDILNYRKDGTPFLNRVGIDPVRDERGRLTHFIGRQRDVTADRRARQAEREARRLAEDALQQAETAKKELQQSEARFRGFAEAASDLFWETDEDFRVTLVSRGQRDASRYQEVVGRNLMELPAQFPPENAHLAAQFRDDLASCRPFKEIVAELGDGLGRRRFRVSGKSYHDDANRCLGYRGVARDITEAYHAERTVRAERARLANAIEGLSEGFALYDPDDGLIVCNKQYRELNNDPRCEILKPGARFEAVIRHAVTTGGDFADEAAGEEWTQRRLAYHRNPATGGPLLFPSKAGQMYLISEHRLRDGITSIIATDITNLEQLRLRLRDAIDSIDAGFVLFDKSDRVTLCNRRYADMMAGLFPGREPIGIPFDEILDRAVQTGALRPGREADREGWPENFRRYHQEPGTEPFLLHDAQGRTLQVLSHLTEAEGCVCVISDVTALVEAAAAMRRSEQRFRTLVESSPDAVIVADRGGRIDLVNEQARRIFGYSVDEFASLGIGDLIPERSRPAHGPLMERYFRNPGVRPMGLFREVVGRRKNGSEVPLEIALGMLGDPRHPMVIATVRDVTERKIAEDMLRRSQKMEALGTLAGGIAHDLNNTLQPILFLSSLLREDAAQGDPRVRRMADIEAAAIRARDLVHQILTFTRGDTERREPVDVCAEIRGMKMLLRATIPAMVDLTFDAEVPQLIVNASRTGIHQIVLNLVKNASDAIEGNVGCISVTVQRYRHRGEPHNGNLAPGEYAEISVHDTGKGMDAATVARIFEPFFTTKGVGEGTGLGLAIVHGVVKSFGGTVAVASKPGHGTAFRVFLPLAAGKGSENGMSTDMSNQGPGGGQYGNGAGS